MKWLSLSFNEIDTKELRRRLNEKFGRLGYATEGSACEGRERKKPWSGGLKQGLLAIDRGEVALVKWVSVEERLPARTKIVLAVWRNHETGQRLLSESYVCRLPPLWIDRHGDVVIPEWSVTHWAEMPMMPPDRKEGV